MALDLSSLIKAVDSLDKAFKTFRTKGCQADLDEKNLMRAGVIQNFEFTYELCWKYMKRWLETNMGNSSVDGAPRKELFRIAAESLLIKNTENWFEYHEARNQTAHTYNANKAEEVYLAAEKFLDDAKDFLGVLSAKND